MNISTSYFLNSRHHLGVAHGRGKRLRRSCLLLVMSTIVFLAAGCEKPDYRSQVTPSLCPTISSDGKMILSENAEAPLRGIVMRFKEGQCAPVSVRTLFDRREE